MRINRLSGVMTNPRHHRAAILLSSPGCTIALGRNSPREPWHRRPARTLPPARCPAPRIRGCGGNMHFGGLVEGKAFSMDASLIKADVDKTKRLRGDPPIAWAKAEEDLRCGSRVRRCPGA